MSETKDLLVELGVEELPTLSLKPLQKALETGFASLLEDQRLTYSAIETFATPRRLAIRVNGLLAQQENREQQRLGPKLDAAYDSEGKPTQAAIGFAKSCGVEVSELLEFETDKGVRLGFNLNEQGKQTTALLPTLLEKLFTSLPLPKKMRWGANKFAFIRPAHWLVVLFGKEVVETTLFGVKASDKTLGHRFLHPEVIELPQASDYESCLQNAHVVANFEQRKTLIRNQIEAAAKEQGGQADIREALLEEVVGLVEWPNALLVHFDDTFLAVPQEALISAMESHQKCFPVRDEKGDLMPFFITVSNMQVNDYSKIINGNERVMRARLADAEYFFQSDQKTSFDARKSDLDAITFQEKLGSIGSKVKRIETLSAWLSQTLKADEQVVASAAAMAKNDLTTDMVGEFPELQGTMGYYYALSAGQSNPVAIAIKEHYYPRFSGDALPSSLEGAVISVADKMDTILGIFSIGKGPTGEKDPFALRRAALGILRIILEQKLDLDLKVLVQQAKKGYDGEITTETEEKVIQFFLDRLRAWCLDKGIETNVINAVMAKKPSNPLDFIKRIDAVCDFMRLAEAESLAKANKRVVNILKQMKDAKDCTIDESLLQEPAEKSLAEALAQRKAEVIPLYERREYASGLKELARLRQPVDQFFDDVLVNAEDEKLKYNRLTLLKQLQDLFLEVADISQLSQ